MRKLPPLNAIRAFEAAARHESFTAAASLHVPLIRRRRSGHLAGHAASLAGVRRGRLCSNLVALIWMAGPILGSLLLFFALLSPVRDEITTGNIHLLIAVAIVLGFRRREPGHSRS